MRIDYNFFLIFLSITQYCHAEFLHNEFFLTPFNLYLRMISNKEDRFYFSENSFSLFIVYQILRSESKIA